MNGRVPIPIGVAVEGDLDQAVVERLLGMVGTTPWPVAVLDGKENLRRRVQAYVNASRYSPWLILTDLDSDFECASPLRKHWYIPDVDTLCFRVAVREVEAWLIADAERLSRFIKVRSGVIPRDPDAVGEPNEKSWISLSNRAAATSGMTSFHGGEVGKKSAPLIPRE